VTVSTEQLIGRLAAEVGATPRRPWLRSVAGRLALASSVSAIVVLLILLTLFGGTHSGHGGRLTILVSLGAALTLAGAACAAALALSRPEVARTALPVWVPAAVIFALGIATELALVPRGEWFARMVGGSPLACFLSVFALSLPVLAGALWALRAGAPAHPRRSGAFAGMIAGGVTAALYLLHCPGDSLLYALAWHVPALLAVIGLGTALGPRLLRW
jgi:hypothetical protein